MGLLKVQRSCKILAGRFFFFFSVRFAVRPQRAGQQQTFSVFPAENPPSALSTVAACGLFPHKEIDIGSDSH